VPIHYGFEYLGAITVPKKRLVAPFIMATCLRLQTLARALYPALLRVGNTESSLRVSAIATRCPLAANHKFQNYQIDQITRIEKHSIRKGQ